MLKKCIRCGDETRRERDLRCAYCRQFVDEELRWEKEREREFYNKRLRRNATIRNTKRVRQQA